ncbi:hypothetical protein FV139_04580 [Parahaliea maris]|uniref:Lipoprotein n=1 Tax=Parahaliea maris TaxID=2716870 RepID=A0A5C9A5Z1_9GAMM|nr:hypothetical protein [Parahaliea maris]TXS95180.1 hypothetical protein FV139_04580 [Parahaliea maris]
MRLTPMKKGLLVVAGSLAMTGCVKMDGTVSGGGTMHSLGGKGKAVFTVNAQRCDDKPVKGHVNFRDETAIDWQEKGGVAFKADVIGAGLCGPDIGDPADDPLLVCQQACETGMYQVDFEYDSTNPLNPGPGTGFACMTDLGEGINGYKKMHGLVNVIAINAGPYLGYVNGGVVSGNIQTKECPGAKNDDTEATDENA